jgi:hypothetical protein
MVERPGMAFATFLLLLATYTNGFVIPHQKDVRTIISTSRKTTELHGIRTFVRNRFAKGKKDAAEVGQDSKVKLTSIVPEDPVEETKPLFAKRHVEEGTGVTWSACQVMTFFSQQTHFLSSTDALKPPFVSLAAACLV